MWVWGVGIDIIRDVNAYSFVVPISFRTSEWK